VASSCSTSTAAAEALLIAANHAVRCTAPPTEAATNAFSKKKAELTT
jgi:hypothetical protein